MKSFSATIVALSIFLSQDTTAFTSPSIIHHSRRSSSLYAAELIAEPEGGEELTKISSSLPGSRMKNLGAEDEEGVFKFWLSATADGGMVKKFRLQTEKDASKKANFPGFRKVRIYIQLRTCLYFANVLQIY